MRKARIGTGTIVGAVVALLACAGLSYAIVRTQARPEGPVAIVWDNEACAHCHMHVSDRAYATQLQTTDRRVLNFDDPGCLVHYLMDKAPSMHALYIHHSKEERWLDVARVGFVPSTTAPMDFGFAAVDQQAPGAISFQEFSSRVLKPTASAERAPEGHAHDAH